MLYFGMKSALCSVELEEMWVVIIHQFLRNSLEVQFPERKHYSCIAKSLDNEAHLSPYW